MDYGVLPRMLIAPDQEFLQLWGDAGCYALGYTRLPPDSPRGAMPLLMIVFRDIAKGLALFERIKSWGDLDNEGAGIDLALIEDPKYTQYYFVVGPNRQRMTDRAFPKELREHFEPIVLSVTLGKDFPLSQFLPQFRSYAANEPILIAPVSVGDQWPLLKFGFVKKDIAFRQRSQLKEDSWELQFIDVIEKSQRRSKRVRTVENADPALPKATEVASFRKKRIRRFFPVTSMRLPANASYEECSRSVADRLHQWQIEQAACNLICSAKFPEIVKDGVADLFDAYERLIQTPEQPSDRHAATYTFSDDALLKQAERDMQRLCSELYAGPSRTAPIDYRQTLGEGGYI